MNKEQQISEIAKFVCNACDMGGGFDGECCLDKDYKTCLASAETAEEIINAGYRKYEWISVEDRLPEESGDYLIYRGSHFQVVAYSNKYRLFNAYDSVEEDYNKRYAIYPEYWMHLPEPPKGE